MAWNATAVRVGRAALFALGFMLFGLGGALMQLVLVPLVFVLWRPPQRAQVGKRIVHRAMAAQVWLMQATGAMTLTVHGREKLQRKGLLILPNHPSLIDVVILMGLIEQPDCVVKAAMWRNPFTAGVVRMAGYISNAVGPDLVPTGLESIGRGNNLIIFPAGTRDEPGQPQHFQRGAANIAVRGLAAITPVIITVSEPTLTKRSKWYRPPSHKPHFCVHVLDDIELAPLLAGHGEAPLQARWLTTWLEQFFSEEIARHDPS
ncbi:lysophospholipid acyltransferase family protein [Amantichitinum ursilacus]|uniref:2-acyl-glycerophospho-ethanolamine acyltransferase n=1 Tax=Amantichitinum ursilacus TaxID=857265 RepID=A0A0N1JTD6_9NEIS|nr:lysophospholipid acyltransferase family protein [Amantichitinum ursilacus]KPC54076.1 2-acyl-glycerophospho-ethanolamine acyltransferase [Amantichitinum ursilacus]